MRTLVAAITFVFVGCHSDDERASWIRSALTSEHRLLVLRAPALVAEKYTTMAAHPYDYFRGTLPLWVTDTFEPGGVGQAPTRFASPTLSHMLLIGDPHPENVGTYLAPSSPGAATLDPRHRGAAARGDMAIEFNDFDAATFGPPIHDLRRLATGLRLLVTPVVAVDSPLMDGAVTALVEGYRQGLADTESDDGENLERGAILEDLVTRAFEDRLEAADWTGPEYVVCTEDEHRFVEALLTSWPSSCLGACPEPTLKRLVRRLGAGVASLPLLRFYAVIEGETPDASDDLILDLKEAREGPELPLPRATLPFPADHNAARVVFAQRLLQSHPRVDPLLGTATLWDESRTSFRVSERAPSSKGLARERIAERLADGRWRDSDLLALSRALGHLLGEAHARAPLGPDHKDVAGPELLALSDIDLVPELVSWSRTMALQTETDHALFVALLDRHGPLLESGR